MKNRTATVTATYQMLGSTKPKIIMEENFDAAKKAGAIKGGEIADIRRLGGNDFFEITFTVGVSLEHQKPLAELFADAKILTDKLVGDTDTVITNIQFHN